MQSNHGANSHVTSIAQILYISCVFRDLSFNSFSGNLPPSFQYLKNLKTL